MDITSISEHPSWVTTPKPLLDPYLSHYQPAMALIHAEALPDSSSDYLKVVQVALADADVPSLSLTMEKPEAENFEGRIFTYFGGRENIDIFWRKRQSKKKEEGMKSKGNQDPTCNTKE